MLSELNLTDARKEFSSLYDQVFNSFQPAIIKRKKSEEVILLRVDQQRILLANYSLKPEIIPENDGSITLALDNLEIYSNGSSLEDAIKGLIDDLKVYASDYLQRSQLFLNAPNRKSHFPYVLRVLLSDSDDEIRDLLELSNAS